MARKQTMNTEFPTIHTPAGDIPDRAPAWNRQRHSHMPSNRYRDIYQRVEVPLTQRHWPDARITQAPLWVPVDLRDGNQALAEPMDPARKRRFFELMIAMGYKEIEVGYPSASQTDFDFVRLIAEDDLAPEDVTIVVFTPARRDLIERTVASIRGIPNDVVIHMYTATAPAWRDIVLGKDRAALRELILDGGRAVLAAAGDLPNVRFEFSPEVFNLTEPDYVLDICDRMTTLWDATAHRPVVLNLPATVEVATPNVYADQIEYMHRNLARRDSVILSVHPHNDRGTGIACAELAVLAGAQRVEGCLFGNGERTGNVDIATLALNLHAQGVDPMIDFSDIDEVRRTVEYCTRMPVHERHPYVGELVHTAFSGTHQDAIKKGFAEHRARAAATGIAERELDWRVPYLPIDPGDLGRGYEAVIRVNSQSGKGGIAYLLHREYGMDLPRGLQIDFAGQVQGRADDTGVEITAAELRDLFDASYCEDPSWLELKDWRTSGDGTQECTEITLTVDGVTHRARRRGGPVPALTEALAEAGYPIEVLGLTQQSIEPGDDSAAIAYLEYRRGRDTGWSCGRGDSVLAATLVAVVRAAGRAARR
ncbi:2-isopropylmalate synthase [Nocardia asiatica]|uniref:2-isopropylmalate synthase n=1 Tax=Nocardia asiatica TaxID=209252 RepID=UPI003EE335D7